MAGPEIPARHQTLSKFLKHVTSEPFDRAAALRAIEQHHELLSQGLSFMAAAGGSLNDWHKDVSNQALMDLGVLVGNAELGKSTAQARSVEKNTLWQRARLAQLLVEQFAQKLMLFEAETSRLSLLAGLLGVGHQQLAVTNNWSSRAELIELELAQHGRRGDHLGAEWLLQRGFREADSDVLRYQYEPADTLNEAPQDIALVALAGRVADSLLRDCEFPEDYISVFNERFQLALADMQAATEQAYIAFRAENDLTLQAQDFHEHLALANLAEQLSHVATEAELLEVAAECFQVRQICLAIVSEEALTLSYRGDTFSLPTNQGASAITRAFQSQTVFSAGGNALVAIVDKQVLSRMAANVLWLVPTQQGVAICGVDSEASAAAANPFLIRAFKTGIDHLLAENQHGSAGMIELDLVQSRIRELNHEVNNPLAIVQNYLKTLSLRLGPDDDAQANIKTIADEMLRIGSIINKYAEIGVEPTDVAPLDVNQLLKKHCAMVAAAHPQVKFTLALDEQLPTLALPEVEFTQVLLNLLKNAAEALAGESATSSSAEVLLGSGQVNVNGAHFIEVVVEDNGPGIAPAIYQNLFSPNNSSKGEEHSGIGLSVVHRLITEMGGSISCRNSAAGCQFQILLPTIEN